MLLEGLPFSERVACMGWKLFTCACKQVVQTCIESSAYPQPVLHVLQDVLSQCIVQVLLWII